MSEPRDYLDDADVISSGREDSGAFAAAVTRRMRSRPVMLAAILVLAGLLTAAAVLIPASRPAAPARLAPSAREMSVTNGMAELGSGAFAGGTANGKQWRLVTENIADPGFRCVPAVSVGGNDADPLFADPGVGYAVSVGAGVDHLTAELSDGSNVSAQPLVVGGRKYAAFFVPGQLRLFWLNWVDAAGRPIAGTTGLPGYGFMQFSPAGVPVLKAESWGYGGIS